MQFDGRIRLEKHLKKFGFVRNNSFIDYEPCGVKFYCFCIVVCVVTFISLKTYWFLCEDVTNLNGTMIARSRILKRKQCVFVLIWNT